MHHERDLVSVYKQTLHHEELRHLNEERTRFLLELNMVLTKTIVISSGINFYPNIQIGGFDGTATKLN